MVANNSSSGVGNHTVMGAQQGTQGCNLLGFSQYTHGIAKGHPQSSHGNFKIFYIGNGFMVIPTSASVPKNKMMAN
jgi:hypothetical protein